MPRTILIGHPAISWRDWLREHRGTRDLLCLDPSEPDQEPPGRVTLRKGSRIAAWNFYGSLDSNRAPHVLLAALQKLLHFADEDVLIQLPPYRPSPLMRQFVELAVQIAAPDEILIAQGTPLESAPFPIGPAEVEVPEAFASMVINAQRKAHWIKMLEQCEEHHIDLDKVALTGTRLGSGRRLARGEMEACGLRLSLHAEACGGNLLVIGNSEPDEESLFRAQDVTHTNKATLLPPNAYDGLLCALSRQGGEDFGIGIVGKIDFMTRVATVYATAIAPAPARILRIGGLKLDANGREFGESRPWQV